MVRYIPPYNKYNTHALTSTSLFARLPLTLASAQSHSTQGVLIMSSAKERKNRKERIKRRDQKNVRSRTPEEMARNLDPVNDERAPVPKYARLKGVIESLPTPRYDPGD